MLGIGGHSNPPARRSVGTALGTGVLMTVLMEGSTADGGGAVAEDAEGAVADESVADGGEVADEAVADGGEVADESVADESVADGGEVADESVADSGEVADEAVVDDGVVADKGDVLVEVAVGVPPAKLGRFII